MAVDAALFSGSKCYFFAGARYLRVTRGDIRAGTVDAGYPAPISNWNWPAGFGSTGIDAALYSGSKCYFFRGSSYIQVTRGDTGAGTVDAGYPAPISNWNWPAGSGSTGSMPPCTRGRSATSSEGAATSGRRAAIPVPGRWTRAIRRRSRTGTGRRVREHGIDATLYSGRSATSSEEQLHPGDARRYRCRDGRRGLSSPHHQLGLASRFRRRSGPTVRLHAKILYGPERRGEHVGAEDA